MCYDPIVIMDMKTRVRQHVACRKCLECMQTSSAAPHRRGGSCIRG